MMKEILIYECWRRMGGVSAMGVVTAGVSCSGPAAKDMVADKGEREAWQAAAERAREAAPRIEEMQPKDYRGLHNVVAYGERLYSGSVPERQEGFGTLAGWGVKTIISVDGAIPEVERARGSGMRYIHLPIGYNGFDEQRKRELARAVRDAAAEGPVYVHCHHGKHRSAAAAGTAAAALGWAGADAMVERMKVSGTSSAYTGLYACTLGTRALSEDELERVGSEFPEVSEPSTFVAGMNEANEIVEHLELVKMAGWAVPTEHPDLVPASEAGRLADVMRVMADTEHRGAKAEGFRASLLEQMRQAEALEVMLAERRASAAEMTELLGEIQRSCKGCHRAHRD